MGEQNKPQEVKPLGAAEMIKPFIEQVTEPDGTILDVVAPGRAAVISEQYADQQTAALREDIGRLQTSKQEWADLAFKRRAELDKEKGMRLAQGVYVQQLKDELEAVETELQYKSENLTEALRQIEHYENRLEAVKKELQGMKDEYHAIDENGNHIGYGYWKDEYFRMQESASKYMKQRDELKNEKAEFDSKIMELMIHHEKQLSEVTRQRDELHQHLETAISELPNALTWEQQEKIRETLSRLSSGETKPANPCIHPEWGTDGGGDYCKKCGFRL